MSNLGERQEELVRALVAGGTLPAGFDEGALTVTSAALIGKRAGEVAQHLPVVRHELGERYFELFRDWANGRPKTSSHADARSFFLHLEQIGAIAPASRPSRWRTLRHTFGFGRTG